MKKTYIFRQVYYEEVENYWNYYKDNLEDIYIIGNDRFYGNNTEEFSNINLAMDDIITRLKDKEYYNFYTDELDIVKDCTPITIRENLTNQEIKEFFNQLTSTDYEITTNFLTLIKGEEYTYKVMKGYSQGDWQGFVYPQRLEDFANYLGDIYFNRYDEFELLEKIEEDEESLGEYYILTESQQYQPSFLGYEALKENLREQADIERDSIIELQLIEGTDITTRYNHSYKTI